MSKVHYKTLNFHACGKRELDWFLAQDHDYLYGSILDRIQIVVDDAERNIPDSDLDLLQKLTEFPMPTLNGVVSDERYSPLDQDVAIYIDNLIQAEGENETNQCKLLQMFACDCILAASNITANCFVHEGKLHTYKDYKPVKILGEALTETGYYILKVVQACNESNDD